MAARVLEARARILPAIREKIDRHLAIVREWFGAQETFEWVEPRAGVVCMPRFRDGVEVDVDRFYADLLAEHGTYVGPGHWFDQDRRSFRRRVRLAGDGGASARARRPARRRRRAQLLRAVNHLAV